MQLHLGTYSNIIISYYI